MSNIIVINGKTYVKQMLPMRDVLGFVECLVPYTFKCGDFIKDSHNRILYIRQTAGFQESVSDPFTSDCKNHKPTLGQYVVVLIKHSNDVTPDLNKCMLGEHGFNSLEELTAHFHDAVKIEVNF